eukprot:11191613-Lingulodinium_polyedra.AAC.1
MSDAASNVCDSVHPGGSGPDVPGLASASCSDADWRKVRSAEGEPASGCGSQPQGSSPRGPPGARGVAPVAPQRKTRPS